jgi:hypothetical protein
MDIDKIVGAYVKMRDDLDAKRKEFKEFENERKAQMAKIEDHILKLCYEQGVESFKTVHGTAFKKKKDFVKVNNWDAALDFIIHNDLKHILTKSVRKDAVKEFMKENKNQLPPGLEYGAITEIGIRRKPQGATL